MQFGINIYSEVEKSSKYTYDDRILKKGWLTKNKILEWSKEKIGQTNLLTDSQAESN